MATRSLNVVISGDAKPLGIASKKAVDHMGDVEKSGHRMGKTLALGFAAAGAAAAGALVVGLKKSVDAAVESERSLALLKTQVRAAGEAYGPYAKQIDQVIQKHSQLAGVDDEELQDAFTGIVRATGSVNTAMRDMGLVTDLVRGKNMSAAKAGDLLSKVHNGNVGALKRLGIALDPVTVSQDKLRESGEKYTVQQMRQAKAVDKAMTGQKGIAELQKRFGGQAEAYGKTAAGAQDRFAVAMENVQEKLGAKLLPVLGTVANAVSKFLSQIDRGTGAGGRFAAIVSGAFDRVKSAVQAAIPTAIVVFDKLKTAITNVVSTVRGIVTGFQEGKGGAVALVSVITGLTAAFVAWRVAVTVASAVTRVYAGVQAALNVVMTANPIGLVVVALVGLGAALVVAYKKSETFRGIVDGTFKTVKTVVGDVMDWIVPKVKTAFTVISAVVGVAVTVIRGYVKAYAKAAEAIVGAITGAFDVLKGLPGKVAGFFSDVTSKIRDWEGNFARAALGIGKSIGSGIVKGLGSLGHMILDKAKDALDFVGDNLPGLGLAQDIGKGIRKKLGDGAGQAPALPGGGLSGGGSLMGAKSIMSPFVSMAGRFGLHTSSGLRPGAITSSGNPSFHGSGNAVDEAGTPEGMLGYFRYLKAKFGSRLRELIYTPGGQGIKDGRPFTYTGQVAADHFDHVHVAFTGGAGDGVGRVARTGDGIGEATRAAYAAGFRGTNLVNAVAIAGAETGYDADAENLKYPDHSIGDWQINQLAHHGRFGTDKQLHDPFRNARAAYALFKESGFKPWSTWPTAAAAYTARARAAVQSFSASGSKTSGSSGGGKSAAPSFGGFTLGTPATFGSALAGYSLGSQIGNITAGQSAGNIINTRPTSGPLGKGVVRDPDGSSAPDTVPYVPPGGVTNPLGQYDATLTGFANRGTLASLTESLSDDLGVEQDRQSYFRSWLPKAQQFLSDGVQDQNDVWATWVVESLKTSTDAIKTLTDSIDQSTELQRQRDEVQATIASNGTKLLALAAQGDQIVSAVIAAANGGIGGQVGLGMQSPGYAGGVANYGAGRL